MERRHLAMYSICQHVSLWREQEAELSLLCAEPEAVLCARSRSQSPQLRPLSGWRWPLPGLLRQRLPSRLGRLCALSRQHHPPAPSLLPPLLSAALRVSLKSPLQAQRQTLQGMPFLSSRSWSFSDTELLLWHIIMIGCLHHIIAWYIMSSKSLFPLLFEYWTSEIN